MAVPSARRKVPATTRPGSVAAADDGTGPAEAVRNSLPAMAKARGPERRTAPMPPRPGGVAMATMVSSRGGRVTVPPADACGTPGSVLGRPGPGRLGRGAEDRDPLEESVAD